MKIGDKVRIIDVDKIEGSEGYFKNGDVTEVTTYKGYLALKHTAKELQGGLVICPWEERFLEVVEIK